MFNYYDQQAVPPVVKDMRYAVDSLDHASGCVAEDVALLESLVSTVIDSFVDRKGTRSKYQFVKDIQAVCDQAPKPF